MGQTKNLFVSQQQDICAAAIAFGARTENAREEMKLHHAIWEIIDATSLQWRKYNATFPFVLRGKCMKPAWGELFTDLPAYSDTVYSDTPLIVTLLPCPKWLFSYWTTSGYSDNVVTVTRVTVSGDLCSKIIKSSTEASHILRLICNQINKLWKSDSWVSSTHFE